MKDYEANIIPYRGGSALLIDSFDIMTLNTRSDPNSAKMIIEEHIEKVDYVLLITSLPHYSLRPFVRNLFRDQVALRKQPLNCYRHITESGHKILREKAKEMHEDLLKNLANMEKI